jgi:hypothetical protein
MRSRWPYVNTSPRIGIAFWSKSVDALIKIEDTYFSFLESKQESIGKKAQTNLLH